MIDVFLQVFGDFLNSNWGWALALGAGFGAFTIFAGGLLHPTHKETLALWLMGAQSEENWAKTFTALFDAVFGKRHLSLKCFLRSAIASLVAVTFIWTMMGESEAFSLRLQAELSLEETLAIALAVNVLADYVSLLETRWLLSWLKKPRSVLFQIGVLLLDFVVSAAIIWIAIRAYVETPFHEGEIDSFAQILGVFSLFSVFFYSSFLTSVWTWAYILSTWLLRLFLKLRLARIFDIEDCPHRVVATVLAILVFVSSLAAAIPLNKGEDGITLADRSLCEIFRDSVCLHVAKFAVIERSQIKFIHSACEGGIKNVRIGSAGIDWTKTLKTSILPLSGMCDGCADIIIRNDDYCRHAYKYIDLLKTREAIRIYRENYNNSTN